VRFDELLTPGSPVTLGVERGGRDLDLQMTVGKKETDYPSDVCNSVMQIQISLPGVETSKMPSLDPRNMEMIWKKIAPMWSDQSTSTAGGTFGGMGTVFVMTTPSTPSMARYAGAGIGSLDDDARNLFGVQGDGVLVVDLPPGSPAELAGLRRFDVITKVNGVGVSSPMIFQRLAVKRTLVLTVFHKDQGTRIVTIAAPPQKP
jgi:hypothetical protein